MPLAEMKGKDDIRLKNEELYMKTFNSTAYACLRWSPCNMTRHHTQLQKSSEREDGHLVHIQPHMLSVTLALAFITISRRKDDS